MFGARKLTLHANLVSEMGRVTGADLGEALVRGDLTAEGLRTAVVRCTGCADADGCAHWLAEHAEGAEAPPSVCENGDLFRRLAAL
jgi:hypothetical protein